MVELERRGIPTVLFTAQTFVHDAHRSAASFGLAGLPLAVVPLPFTNQTPADIHGMAERAFDQVRAGLTRPVEAPKAVERPPLDERLRYDGDDLLDAWGRMQRSEEHTSELQSRLHLVCRLLLEKKKKKRKNVNHAQEVRDDI